MKRFLPVLFFTSALVAEAPAGLKLGDPCPSFSLPGTDGKVHGPVSSKPLMVVFLSTECPFVRGTQGRIQAYAAKYAGRVAVIGIDADDIYDHGKESMAAMQAQAKQQGFTFTYLKDEPQTTARAFGAVCTPDFFLFNASGKLVYRGRLDDGGVDPSKVKTRDLEVATEAMLGGKPIPSPQHPSRGCAISWK
ncbi:thioredoxin family protein [Geothrix sp. PMB-07]|uniref:thioredoxin family protein n=1 Tax=Geothrix sp. PMB-07 TaxID=3068640 RepID=UPI0027407DD6|nr:thioredoxin family protein [Geothrix sp. PMB-07]WLT31585.1 thioredoxin family protein [Geothrix sp. PMB-07]